MNDKEKILTELLKHIDIEEIQGDTEILISGITIDSRHVKENNIFVGIKGNNIDGLQFAENAINNGAVCVIGEKLPTSGQVRIKVNDIDKTLAILSREFYNKPDENLIMIGITGTNGKTTTSYLVEEVLNKNNFKTGIIGTINYRFNGKLLDKAPFTTPQSPILFEKLHYMKNKGATHVVMEVSSHSLKQKRVFGIKWNVVAFTNLTQDHLDFHKTMEDYSKSKLLLFTRDIENNSQVKSVINIDDEFGKDIVKHTKSPNITYSLQNKNSSVFAKEYKLFSTGIKAEIITPCGILKIDNNLLGKHNLYNILTTVAISSAIEIPLNLIEEAINEASSVPGRLEKIDDPDGRIIVVDYAHTPSALTNVITTLRQILTGRLIVVFGAGGDRDKEKRALMGKEVAKGADVAIVTNDNPRTEDPDKIISMILNGMSDMKQVNNADALVNNKVFLVESDRRKAISTAVNISKKGDIVLIAGKGHENYQLVGKQTLFFDDRIEVMNVLQKNCGDCCCNSNL